METIKGPAAQGSDSEVARVLRGARDRLECKGWTQGNAALGPRECVGIAIDRASVEFVLGRDGAFKLFRRVAGYTDHIVDWNDAPERTQAEVFAKLDEAIALAEGTAPTAPSAIPASPTSTGNEGDGNA